jgi:cytochrome c oxidase cbb3-type subunit 2
MKNLPLLFFGIFFTLAFSWTGLILSSVIQYGDLEPTTPSLVKPDPLNLDQPAEDITPIRGAFTEVTLLDGSKELVEGVPNPDEADVWPRPLPGLAERGKQVYISLGCMYCHSQQVRPPGFGTDDERGWGRQTVARDYILQERVLLGTMRTGPDLMNVGDRPISSGEAGRIWHHQHFFDPQITSKGSTMPSFKYLYKIQKIGDEPHPRAVPIDPETTEINIPEGHEVIPTERAEALVAYMQSLSLRYGVPESPLPE